MNLNALLIATLPLVTTSCKSQAAIPTPSDVFGAIPLNSVQAFTLEPIARVIVEHQLKNKRLCG